MMKLPALLLAALILAPAALAGAPTLPDPGQAVTWTSADSPVLISGQLTIPAGGTVLVDPGVTLQFASSSRLFVQGALTATGTPSQPVNIVGSASGWLVARGAVTLSHCLIDNTIAQGTNGVFRITDSTFGPSSWTVTDLISGPTIALVERCTIQTPFFDMVGEVLLRDVQIQGQTARVGGYMRLDGVSCLGTPLELWREYQRAFVDSLSVSGAPGAGLVLDGGTDFLIDGSVQLVNNGWPLQTEGSGLVPGSVLPLTGNVNDAILGFEGNKVHKQGRLTMPDLGLPYDFLEDPEISAPLRVEPGVTMRFGPSGSLGLRGDMFLQGQDLRGLPGQPITLESRVPGQNWLALAGIGGNYLFEHLVIDGASLGVSAPQASIWVNETTIRDCQTGVEPSGLGTIATRGVQFLDNLVGARTDSSIVSGGGLILDGTLRPNVFAGNQLAFDKANFNSGVTPAKDNWWNHPSGPFQASGNPSGQGDPVDVNLDYVPWLDKAPDLSDTPPVVRIDDPFFLADPGQPLLIQWTVDDDAGIVSQDILLDTKGGGTFAFEPVVTGLGPGVTSYAFVMPDPGFNTFARPALLRVRATDTAGQTSFDEVTLHVSSADYAGSFSFETDLSGSFEPLERFPICWSAFGIASSNMRVHLLLDADRTRKLGPAGSPGTSCTFSDLIIPYVSTDTARLAVIADGNGNDDEWFFSERFTIRPTSLLGDAPPTVQMTSPVAGQSIVSGKGLAVTWTASDDEALRGFDVQVSLNAGRTWNAVARDLPATATSYLWPVPPGLEAPDARVRVIAFDRRFQNSSDGTETSLSIGGELAWTNLGGGLSGTHGVPQLVGSGPLTPGSNTALSLSGGLAGAPTWIILGFSEVSVPFFGGTLAPAPDILAGPFPLDGQGALGVAATWPAGLPPGFQAWWQTWSADAGAIAGYAGSNALLSTTP